MKRLSLVLVFCATPVLAQISVTPGNPGATLSGMPQQLQAAQLASTADVPVRRAEPVKAATPAPKATPAEPRKSGGFFGFFRRLFGIGSSDKAAATPKPSVSPKATPVAKPAATPAPKASPTPNEAVASKPVAVPTPAAVPIATPKAPKSTPAPSAASIEPTTTIPSTMSSSASDPQYLKIKQQALKDSAVAALLQKMTALPEGSDAYKAAAHAYTKALFGKMRKLDPSQDEAFQRKEGAYQRRIDAGKAILE